MTQEGEVALIITYNHRFDKNLDVLEAVYANRFSNIFHLMPFYEGSKPNVIPVYENSRYFQGYLAQGLSDYYDEKYEHYIFIADDLMLNPIISEQNYKEIFNLDEKTAFITALEELHQRLVWWERFPEAYRFSPKKKGLEAVTELPTYAEAIEKFAAHDLAIRALSFNQIVRYIRPKLEILKSIEKFKRYVRCVYSTFGLILRKKYYHLSYPLIGSYSDIVIVPGKNIKTICHMCGAFAAMELFVELALPTALVLGSEKVVVDSDLELHGKALWVKSELKSLEIYVRSLSNLLSNFPEGQLYVHPIKLSEWDTLV